MELKKTENTIKGTVQAILNRFVGIVMPFILRTVMIKRMGIEYAGLNGLFTSVLSMLSLSELGFGESIIYSMYEPIKNDDHQQLGRLLGYCRKIYRRVGVFILGAGCLMIPFLPMLIKEDMPSAVNLYILYIGFLIDCVGSYFFGGYRISLINAHQRNDVALGIQTSVFVVSYTIQIILVSVFRNYYLYLLVMIIQNLTVIYLTYRKSWKMYPDITVKEGLSNADKQQIKNNVVGIVFHRFGDTLSTSLDSMVISAFLGLTAVAIYGNYNFVFISVLSIMSTFFGILTAGIGNKILTSDLEENRNVFRQLNYVSMRLTTFCCACMMALYQPFMKTWMGEKLMYPLYIAALFVLYFFIAASRKLINTYKNALGMWLVDKWKSIVACIFNLVFNVIMIQKIGIAGVVLSTILSYAVVEIPWEVHVVFRDYFKEAETGYYKTLFLNLIETALVSAAAYWAVGRLIAAGMTNIIAVFAAGIVISALMVILLHFREAQFRQIMDRALETIKKMRRKEA